jgi:phospholipid/cholesterol/gamma-HCH transport system substrate-binding protein
MSTQPMRRPRRRLAGLVALLASTLALSSCSIYDIPLPGGPDVGSNPITVHIMFRDVLDLVPQSTVKVDDVTVGKVSSLKL